MFTNFDNLWQKDDKEAEIMQSALIFHLTQFASPLYRVKRRCSKLLHNAVIISIRLLIFALSVL